MTTLRNLLAAGLLLLGAAACTKKDDPAPATTGSVEGTVVPANALSGVTATNAGGLTFPAMPAASGVFTVANLAPGTYTLTFDARTGFLTPASRTVLVVAGQTATAGTVLVAVQPPGSVTGTISPANAVVRVEVTSATGTLTSAVPDAGGSFVVPAVLGTSSVRFVMASGFVQLPSQTATATVAAPVAALGTIAATPLPAVGTLEYEINGQPYVAATSTVSVAGGVLRIEGLTPNAQTPTKIVISAGSFTGAGNYTLGGPAANNFGQLIPLQSPQNIYQTSTNVPGGTLNVSAYNATARTITGTFSFTTATPASVFVTSGQFNLVF